MNTETIDVKTGLYEDNIVVRRAATGVDATKIILQLGSIAENAPGDRATDVVRILGTDEEAERDYITSLALSADESTHKTQNRW